MSLDKLIKDGKIVPFKATKQEVKRALKIAERDLEIAEATFDKSLDWCFSICYNAYLQACRAYMFSLGYRSFSYQSHKTTIEFMEHTLDESHKDLINYFDRARRKRHRLIYNDINAVSITETKEMLHKVEVFLNIIKDKINM